jgi:hypothetical protein
MGAWVALLGEEHDEKEMADTRANSAAIFDIDKFTCDDCQAKRTCPYVFDPYNTDGDCLAEK